MKKSFKQDIIQFLKSENREINLQNILYSFANSSIQCVLLIRLRSYFLQNKYTLVLSKITGWILERFYSTSIFTTDIGAGLLIPHPLCVVINAKSIGENCTILQGCTIGLLSTSDPQKPIIGNEVYLGAGAKILGPIKVGDGSTVGANAVVLSDIPENAVAVGIPARTLSKK